MMGSGVIPAIYYSAIYYSAILGQGELPFSLTIPPFAIQAIPGGMDLSPLCSFVLVRGGPWCTVLLRW